MKYGFLPNCRKGFALLVLISLFAFSATAHPVGAESARLVATHFLNNNGARSMGLKDLTAQAGFANVYVFSTENSFVLVAADDCMQPILGYSLNGSFDLDNMPVNKAAWIQEYSQSIQYAVEHQTRATSEVLQEWNDLAAGRRDAGRATTVVAPLVQTKWEQQDPYNLLCPSGTVTGCVATAMAQVMKYWNYPAHGVGSHSYTLSSCGELSADFQNTTYDWDNMLYCYGYYFDESGTYHSAPNGSDTERTAVATLMYHCGVSVDMDYGPAATGGSGAATSYVADALKTYFNYSSDTRHLSRQSYDDDVWIGMLKDELDLSRPIQYHGRGSGGGHSFVVDGYNSSNYFHVNWGWSGRCNEYYSVNNMYPGPGGTGSGAFGIYNDGQGAIFGIHPSNCTASEPTNLTYAQEGRSITFSWTAASGAAGYNVYCDHNLVGQTSSTTFTHNASFGSSIYWVRSVDANGELSLSSNVVDVTVDYPVPVINDLEASLTDNNVSLTWTAPDWCYPETPTDTLTYGDKPIDDIFGATLYGHRYPAADLAEFANKAVYKVGVYVLFPGDYTVYVYTDTEDGKPKASSLVAETQSIHCPNMDVWMDFDLDGPVMLSGTNDLWVIIKQQNTGQPYPIPCFVPSTYNANACYAGSSIDNLASLFPNDTIAFYARTYVTDGTYTYNLYRNGSKIGNNLSTTSYSDNGLAAGVYNYFVKTNYYAGESPASNQVIQPVGTYDGHYFVIEGNWNNTSNWLPAELPTGTDDVYVAASVTIPDGCVAQAGNITMNSPEADFTIAEGGQLVSGNTVNGTIQKNITGYGSGDDGWYFIASPVDGFTPDADNLLTDSYDLYRFDQTQEGAEWRNYRANNFSLSTGEGYLYASHDDVTLNITGELTATKAPVALANETSVAFEGWNLIGNPYPCNVTINVPFYRMEGDGSGLAAQITSLETTAIKPMEGVFVQYTTEVPSVSFTKAPEVSAAGSRGALHLSLSQGRGLTDNAIVRFDGGKALEKFSLLEGGSRLYIPQGDKDYAIVNSDAQGEMPLNFKAAKDGEYTLSVNADGLELVYLHLIDNMTGADVDLLSTGDCGSEPAMTSQEGHCGFDPQSPIPRYTFSAKATDYASRFRLVFAPQTPEPVEGTDQPFAFVDASGNIILTADASDASLQVIDALGHIVRHVGLSQCGSRTTTAGLVPGMYVLRLISNESVRTQKIVIR